MSQKIVPYIWFDERIDEAGEFYALSIPNTVATVNARYPHNPPEWQADFAGKTLTLDLHISGFQLSLLHAGTGQRPNPSISFMLNFDPLFYAGGVDAARTALETTWAALNEGGTALMPLKEYPFSPYYGWVEDRFGVSWQLILTSPHGDPRPFVMPQLMFGGPVANRAQEAAEHYVSLFGGDLGLTVPFPEQHGPAAAGSLMFGEATLAEQTVLFMDSPMPQDFSFTMGVSLQVRCADQAEIDHYWEGLSAVPEAEVCGWCVDPFGVSWQVCPENTLELLQRPGAYERMTQMKKLVIAEF